jgi:hypothetical protein
MVFFVVSQFLSQLTIHGSSEIFSDLFLNLVVLALSDSGLSSQHLNSCFEVFDASFQTVSVLNLAL